MPPSRLTSNADLLQLIHRAKVGAHSVGASSVGADHLAVAFTTTSTPLQRPLARAGWDHATAKTWFELRSGAPARGASSRGVEAVTLSPLAEALLDATTARARQLGRSHAAPGDLLSAMLDNPTSRFLFDPDVATRIQTLVLDAPELAGH